MIRATAEAAAAESCADDMDGGGSLLVVVVKMRAADAASPATELDEVAAQSSFRQIPTLVAE